MNITITIQADAEFAGDATADAEFAGAAAADAEFVVGGAKQ